MKNNIDYSKIEEIMLIEKEKRLGLFEYVNKLEALTEEEMDELYVLSDAAYYEKYPERKEIEEKATQLAVELIRRCQSE